MSFNKLRNSSWSRMSQVIQEMYVSVLLLWSIFICYYCTSFWLHVHDIILLFILSFSPYFKFYFCGVLRKYIYLLLSFVWKYTLLVDYKILLVWSVYQWHDSVLNFMICALCIIPQLRWMTKLFFSCLFHLSLAFMLKQPKMLWKWNFQWVLHFK